MRAKICYHENARVIYDSELLNCPLCSIAEEIKSLEHSIEKRNKPISRHLEKIQDQEKLLSDLSEVVLLKSPGEK